MKLIVIAKANTASVNIGKILRKKYSNIGAKIFEIEDNVLDLDKYEKEFQKLNPELIIVASSHKSEAGIPMLNCHAPGNWSSADLGGKIKTLSIAPA
ncbi:MAG: D-aminoacyl-tRNA deacylase, partial [Candidatus Nanoarchaeia archaeon]